MLPDGETFRAGMVPSVLSRGAARLLDLLVSLITGPLSAKFGAIARKAAFAAATLAFALMAIGFGAFALFLALSDALGPLKAALVVAGFAAALAFIASIPVWRRPPPPPVSAAATLSQLAVAVALSLLAARRDKPENPPGA